MISARSSFVKRLWDSSAAMRRMVCVLAAAALSLAMTLQALAGEPFKFIQFTDVHLGWGRHDSRGCLPLAREAAEIEDKVDFVVVTGDILDKGFAEPNTEALREFKEFLASFKVPVYCLPGNHDFCHWKHEESVTMRAVENFKREVAPINGVFECKGYRMILFCELPLTKWCTKIEGYSPLNWLENALNAQPQMPSIVFMHVPPDKSWNEEKLAKWKELIGSHDVKAVICGHYHADDLSWEGKMPLIAAFSCTNKEGLTPSFKVYSVDKEGKLSFKTHYLKKERE